MKLMAISLAILMVVGGFMLYPIAMQNDDGVSVSADRTSAVYDDTEILCIQLQIYNTYSETTRYVGWGTYWEASPSGGDTTALSGWTSSVEVSTNDVIQGIIVQVLIDRDLVTGSATDAPDYTRVSLDIDNPSATNQLSLGYSDWDFDNGFAPAAYSDSYMVEYEESGLNVPIDTVGDWTIDMVYQVYLV